MAHSVFALIGLTTQLAVLVSTRGWRTGWGRVGLAYAVLMLVLGPAVWEDHPGAAPRVLLPMTVAFNVALRERAWFWPLYVLGNLTVIPGLAAI